jgi:hypothetical protein
MNQSNAKNVTITNNLHGSLIDPLLLGGASIVAFIFIRLINPVSETYTLVAVAMMALANVVNHPHFAHSYQIFYSTWSSLEKSGLPSNEHKKWWLVGFGVPVLLITFLAIGSWQWLEGNKLLLGISVNLMAALVGWHYVKQGFGMAMTAAALKRAYWTAAARKAMLLNAYACWLLTWAYANTGAVGAIFWGVVYEKFKFPIEIVYLLGGVALCTTVWTVLAVYRSMFGAVQRGANWTNMPWSGLIGYFVSLYMWTIFASVDPTYMLVIPFFHSLQYLTVVYRYKINDIRSTSGSSQLKKEIIKFALTGGVLGALGFWWMPWAVDFLITGKLPNEMTGAALGLASFWLFINIHHYFIDSIVWKASNPMVGKHLFGK